MYSEIADVYNEIFPLNHAFLNFIRGYLGKPGTKVLDIACGPGDYVNELSPGYDATGIDRNAGMIHLAKKRNKGTFQQMSFAQIDRLEGHFQCAYCIGNSLSYLPANDTQAFVKSVFRLLNPAGAFILQVVNWDKYRLTGTADFDIKKLSDGRTFHRSYEPSDNDVILFKTELRVGEEVSGAWSDPLYPKYMGDLVSGFKEAGFVLIDKFGDFEKSPFVPQTSPATVIVTSKPDIP